MGQDVAISRSTGLTPEQEQVLEEVLDMMVEEDILCGDFPEGIRYYHRRVAEQMGITLPEAAAT